MSELIAAVLGALVVVVVDRFAARRASVTERRDAHNAIRDIYSELVNYRLHHPNVLALSRDWKADCVKRIYKPDGPSDAEWVAYYGYVELVIWFCTTVLFARKHSLGTDEYNLQHKLLVRYLITEHYPIISDFIAEGKYVSPLIATFVTQETAENGWDWNREHATICSLPAMVDNKDA